MQLILGSSSPYRKLILNKLKIPFIQVSPNIDETSNNEIPEALVKRLANEKAKAISYKHQNSLIITSDQIAVCDGVIFGKPGSHQKAVEQLLFTSGKKVHFYTSLELLNTESLNSQSHTDLTEVSFRKLSLKQIEYYLKKDKPYDCAGSFKVEAFGVTLFEQIKTRDPNALMGLPLIKLVEMLANEGLDPLLL